MIVTTALFGLAVCYAGVSALPQQSLSSEQDTKSAKVTSVPFYGESQHPPPKGFTTATADNSAKPQTLAVKGPYIVKENCGYQINTWPLGYMNWKFFKNSLIADFTNLKSLPSGLEVSYDQIGSQPFSQKYVKENVRFNNGYMELVVPGGQKSAPILGAQIMTSARDILYASVRTTVIASPIYGTCHGMFTYKNDNQESDIEILTGTKKDSPITGVWYTNQRVNDKAAPSNKQMQLPSDATTVEHVYRLDWLPNGTFFYIDDVFQYQIKENVPTTPSLFLWNNWSSGDRNWSAGPPLADSVMRIKKIEMYYNLKSTGDKC